MRTAAPALAALLALLTAGAAVAQPAAPPPTPTVAAPATTDVDLLIRVLEDDAARARLIQELRRTAPGISTPAAIPAPAPIPEAPPSRADTGAGMLAVFSIALSSLGDRMAEIVSNMGNPRGILRWLGDQSLPQQRSLWISLLGYLAGVMAPALTLWWVVRRLLRPVIAMLERRASDVWWKRIPFAVAHLVLLVAPIAAFVAVGYAMLAVLRPPTDARLLLITTLLTAVGIALACNAIAKTLLAPLAPALRPMPMRNEAAAYLYVWIRRFVDLSVYGYFLTQATLLVGVPARRLRLFGTPHRPPAGPAVRGADPAEPHGRTALDGLPRR